MAPRVLSFRFVLPMLVVGASGLYACGSTVGVDGSPDETQVDAGGTGQPDGAAPDAPAPRCGDGKVDPGEACDDGNTEDGDGCRADCGQDLSLCGNGQLDVGEKCDEGPGNSEEPNASCRTNCQPARCGDGVVDRNELCDDGPANGTSGDGVCNACVLRICAAGADEDRDGDGFTISDGDCNDCDPNVNPLAIDLLNVDDDGQPLVAALQIDENCDGSTEPTAQVCDSAATPIDDDDAQVAAKTMDICQRVSVEGYGLVSAEYVQLNGTPLPALATAPLGHGLLAGFGPNVQPRGGAQMVALSSGTARAPGDPQYSSPSGYNKGYSSTYPAGLPYESPACPGVVSGAPHDSIGLKLTLRAPSNATGFTFQSKFYTYEYPAYVCARFNDFAVGMMSPAPETSPSGHILYDSEGNLISINSSLLDVCSPGTYGGRVFTCPAGTSELEGTGFAGHGGTSWLRTTVPVSGGSEFTLLLAVTDAGDGILDSTLLLDGFRWIATPGAPLVTVPDDTP